MKHHRRVSAVRRGQINTAKMPRLHLFKREVASAPPVEDKLRWKHAEAIAKHCPKFLVKGGMGDNKPKKAKGPKKPQVTAETERLKVLLIQVIKRLAKHEPDALELLDKIMPSEPELNDDLEDI
jgi:hypothetical protein